MKDLENKNFQEWIERMIETERDIKADPLLAEKVMMRISAEPRVLPFYVRSFPYLVKAACIAAALLSGIYLGNLGYEENSGQDNSAQITLHDGYIEGLDVLLNENNK